jgi:hypothetical protein
MAEGRRAPGPRRRLGERACRLDVVEGWVEPAGTLRVDVLRDAFRP